MNDVPLQVFSRSSIAKKVKNTLGSLESVAVRALRFPFVKQGIPAGKRIYVVSDIHGCDEQLSTIHGRILSDVYRSGSTLQNLVIYLGDYVDGGAQSFSVVEQLATGRLGGIKTLALMGNHDQMLCNFLVGGEGGCRWLNSYGRPTLMSYGIAVPEGPISASLGYDLRQRFLEALPANHIRFFFSLRAYFVYGDYMFVHAGVRPGVRVSHQTLSDLLCIRKEFTRSILPHDKVIVHGHSYRRFASVRPYRIGLDTGSYFTGKISCLALEGRSWRFI